MEELHSAPLEPIPEPAPPKRLSLRTAVTVGVVLLLIPATLLLCKGFSGRKYYLTSLLVIFEIMLPFFIAFERKKPQARELVVLAVLSALAVVSRAVFAFLPNFKPVEGMIMIAGAAMGAESGFLVGAITMLASNFIFGQTVYTPFQMFAYGFGGFLIGLLCSTRLLPRKRLPLAIAGALIYLVFVGPMLDTSVILLGFAYSDALYVTYLSGLPVNISQSVCTFLTLFFFSKPMLEKLDRIKVKYGLLEDR